MADISTIAFNGIEYNVKDENATSLANQAIQAVSAEVVNRQSEIAIERARINNLARLEEGSTTGDAELQDIRVGYDGTLYETAGEAVREQVSLITDAFEVNVVSDNKFDNIFDASGRFDNSDGTTEIASENYMRTSKYYPITPVAGSSSMNVYVAKEGSGIAWIFFYNENMECVSTQIANAAFTYSNIVVPNNTAYFRMYVTVNFPSTSRIYISNIKLVSTDNVDYEYRVEMFRNSVSYKEQSLTKEQQEIARNNIGAASKADVQTPIWEQCEGELQIGLLQKPGTIASNLTNWAVRIVEIEEGALYRITSCASEAVQMVQFHDAFGNIIGRILGGKPESGTFQQYTKYEVEVPSGTVSIYVCSCFNTDNALYESLETYPIIEKGTLTNIADLVETFVKDMEIEYAPLKGKVIVNFGDSIFGIKRPPNDISTKIANITLATAHNCGFGGCRMAIHDAENYGAFSMYKLADAVASGDWSEQEYAIANTPEGKEAVPTYFSVGLDTLKGIDFSAVDIVTIAYGTNDFAAEVTLDDAENPQATNTYAGALRYSIETLLTAYPQLRIFICSPIYRSWLDASNDYALLADSDTQVMNGVKLTDFVAKAEAVAQEYHLPFIDNYYELGMNKFNRSAYFDYDDGTHPNDAGNQLIADHISKELF